VLNVARRLHSEERGVALIVVMAMLVVLGVIATAVLTNSLQIKQATASERASKQAYASAVNGLQSAMFWLNASKPADTACPPLPGQTTPQTPASTSGLCGPYESDNLSGVAGLTTQPSVNQRYTYWITPILSSSNDTCTGASPVVLNIRSGITVRDRCITAVGQSLNGTKVTFTKRVQARVSAGNALFPVPGIFGASCLSVGVSVHSGDTGCNAGQGASNSDYYGTIGSNGPVDAQMKNWNYDPSTNSVAPAALFLGYTSPTSATIPTYSIKLQGAPVGTPPPTGCVNAQTFCNGSQPPLPYNTSATGPYQNPVHLFGRWSQPFRMGSLFAQPPPMVLGGHSLPAGCTTTDVSVCNNNPLITTTQMTPPSCATIDAAKRTLSIPTGCVVRIPDGTYDFCDITLTRSSAILPANATATGEVRIFLDNKNRTVNGSAACASSTTGKLTLSASGSNIPRWMTNNTATNLSAPDCLTAYSGDPWTALAGQLFVYGAGDPADAVNNYPANVGAALNIPGVIFNGSIVATNSTVNLIASNTCVNGAVAAGAVNIDNNAGFKWDPAVDQGFPPQNSFTFYRTAFSTCATAGFRLTDTSSAPSYPTYPSDGC
jgi:Tfp pilus assembly protein PilX